VTERLAAAGHHARALDLPGCGADPTPASAVTPDGYVDRVVHEIEAAGEPVVLVGHSMGGVTVSRTAERVPDALACQVYVAAFLNRDGESALAELQAGAADSMLFVPGVFTLVAEQGVGLVGREFLDELFYGECDDSMRALAHTEIKLEQAALPALAPLALSDDRYGRVPRHYIRCLRDRAVTPGYQQQMIDASPCASVRSIDTDHSPFLSRPDELVQALLAIAS